MAVTPVQSNVAPGDSVFLRCSHTSTDRGASYTWERLDGMDMMATGRFEASGRSGEVLRITFAEEADSGVYVCRVTSSQGVQTGTAQVFVGKFQLLKVVSPGTVLCPGTVAKVSPTTPTVQTCRVASSFHPFNLVLAFENYHVTFFSPPKHLWGRPIKRDQVHGI